jgi:hypothetical protein
MSLAQILRLGEKLQPFIDNDGCHLYLWVSNTSAGMPGHISHVAVVCGPFGKNLLYFNEFNA